MNLVDSCGWLEYFADGPGADFFADAIENTDQLLVPTICLYEVFKAVQRQRNENSAIEVVAAMQRGKVVDIDTSIALTAARISNQIKLPMADSLILATASLHKATILTQDSDFDGLEAVKYRKKGS